MWNGPRTVDSVEVAPVRWLIVSTSMDMPSTSESSQPHVIAFLPGAGQEVDRCVPFLVGQLDLLDEGVQLPRQRGEQLPQPRVGRIGEARSDDLRRPFLAEQLHVLLLIRPGLRQTRAASSASASYA
jgi:hypothetical protein